MKLGQYEAAISSYDRALAVNPDDPQTLTNRGNALRYTGRYDEAIAAYDLVISLKPTYQPVYYDKAAIYALQGNIEQALENLREGVRLLATWRASGSVSNYAIASAQDPPFNSVRELPEFQALMQEAEASYQKIFGTPTGFYPDYPPAE